MSLKTTGRNHTPLVSIAMPTYNRAHMVGQAIDAVLGQTYSNLQVIIVNDGSRDNTPEILAEYAKRDSRIQVINKENEGIPDTVNRGWQAAKGKYVTWTSDDNLYYPDTIGIMVNYLENHPDVVLVYTDCRYIDGDGAVLYTRECGEPEVLQYDCPIMGSLLFRRSVFDEVEMFRKQWKRVHDFDFYRRVWKKFKVARIPQVLYDYRLHDASMTGDHFAMTTEHARLLESVTESRFEHRAAWARCWHEIARQAEREQHKWRAVHYYLKAAIQEPKRGGKLWDALWRTTYGEFPAPVQKSWRAIKKIAPGNRGAP